MDVCETSSKTFPIMEEAFGFYNWGVWGPLNNEGPKLVPYLGIFIIFTIIKK
jgi:hypothetical protein